MPDKTTVAGGLPVVKCHPADFCACNLVACVSREQATAALAQKDGEIERMKAALRDLVERYEEICRAKDPSYALDDDALTSARATLGSQA